MARIFKEPFTISNGGTYQDHLNAGGDRARLGGVDLVLVDYPKTRGAIVYARFGGHRFDLVDQFGGLYTEIIDGNTKRNYVHFDGFVDQVPQGTWVDEGAPLGKAGDSGMADGVHLHYSKYVNGVNVDPTDEIKEYLLNNKNMDEIIFIGCNKDHDIGDAMRVAGISNPGDVSQQRNVTKLNPTWLGFNGEVKSHNGTLEDFLSKQVKGDIIRVRGNFGDPSPSKPPVIIPPIGDPQLLADGEKYRILKSSLKEIMK